MALVSLAAILCVSCASGQSSQPKTANRTLVVEQNFVADDFDPALGIHQIAILVDKSVYDTLMTINPGDLSKPYPSLATSFTASADAKTFTFNLRHGVKFASGNPFTSADVVWSLTRLNTLGVQSGQNVYTSALTATAPDPYTVVLTSSAPNPSVPMTMTIMNTGILDSVLLQQHGGTDDAKDKAGAFLNSGPVGGTGPYMIQFVDRTSQIVLKANPNYWGPKPVYSTVILRDAPPPSQALDVQDGQAQVALDISPQDAASMNSSSVNVVSGPSADGFYLAMNADPSVFPLGRDPNFRKAVQYGLDYQGLVALAGKGAVQMTGFIPDGILGSLPLSDAPHRDLARAKAALAQVGVANPTVELDFPTDYSLDGLLAAPFATKIQSDLKEVGITVNLVGQPLAVLEAKFEAGKLGMRIEPNTADYPDPTDFTGAFTIQPRDAGADTGFMGLYTGMYPIIDALTTQATSATGADRGPAFQALEKAMNDLGYWTWTLQPSRTLVTAKSVHVTLNPFDFVDLGSVT